LHHFTSGQRRLAQFLLVHWWRTPSIKPGGNPVQVKVQSTINIFWWQITQESCLVIRPPPPCIRPNVAQNLYALSFNGRAFQTPHYAYPPTHQCQLGPSNLYYWFGVDGEV
jgi:hypothetical protein